MWCCGLFFREPEFKMLLGMKAVHIHTGSENPLVNPNPPKSIWAKREEAAQEYFKNLFKNFK